MVKLFLGQLEDQISSSTTWSLCRGLPAAVGLGRAEERCLPWEQKQLYLAKRNWKLLKMKGVLLFIFRLYKKPTCLETVKFHTFLHCV